MRHLCFHAIDQDVATYISALSVRPTDAEIININHFYRDLKDSSVWSNVDGIYIFLGGNEADSKINFRNPGTYNLTKINSPVFTPHTGWKSNGSGYLDTNYNVATSGGLFQRNNASVGVAVGQDILSVGGVIGYASNALLIPRNISNNFLGRLNNIGAGNVSASGAGTHIITRANSTAIGQWRCGAFLQSTSIASTALPSSNMLLLTGNGTSLSDANLYLTFAFFGNSLSGRQINIINNAYARYAAFYGVASV